MFYTMKYNTYYYSRGQVLGRKKLGVKVCSCPRRDMLKEEELEKKRLIGVRSFKRTNQVSDNNTPIKIPKTNNDNDENTIYKVPIVCILN